MATPTAIHQDMAGQKTPRAPSISPIKPSPRRVLGELTPNAKTTPRQQQFVATDKTTTPFGSPLKLQQTVTLAEIHSDAENWGPSPFVNPRKRGFEMVDAGIECERTASASPIRPRDMSENHLHFPPGLASPPTITISELPDDNGSDTEEDEETLHESVEDALNVTADSQITNSSFSHFIDYDACNASDKSSPPSSATTTTRLPVISHVELLRLRLRMAMYRVHTNQTTVPFPNLSLPPQKKKQRPAVPIFQRDPSTSPAPEEEEEDDEDDNEETPQASPTRPASQHTTSIKMSLGGPIGKLLPGPIFQQPDQGTQFRSEFIGAAPVPSSPPVRYSPEKGVGTPMARRMGEVMDSPDKDSLTSSAVKGRAASGLLELMRAR